MIDLVDAEIGPLAERVEGIVSKAYNGPDDRRILPDLTTRSVDSSWVLLNTTHLS